MKNQTVEPLNNAVKHWYLSLIMGVFFIFFWYLGDTNSA